MSDCENDRRVFMKISQDFNIILKSKGDDFYIGGYASVDMRDDKDNPLPDVQGDSVDLEALDKAFQKLMSVHSRRNLMGLHKNVQIGEIVPEYVDSDGKLWKSHAVYKPDNQYIKKGLFVIAKLFSDLRESKRYQQLMKMGHLLSFSIGGEAIQRVRVCHGEKGETCTSVIKDLELYEVSSCEEGANPQAKAFIMKTNSAEGDRLLLEQPITHPLLERAASGATLIDLLCSK